MYKRSSKSESTWKTEQDRSCWKFFTMVKVKVNGQSQQSTIWSKSTVSGWRVLTWQCDVTLGLTWQYVKQSRRMKLVGARRKAWTGAWGAWQHVRDSDNAWRHVGARVMLFMAVLGWVLLRIGCFVALCLYFGIWMSKTMISESCKDCGRDDDDSLLIVTTGWRRRQRKNATDVHRN